MELFEINSWIQVASVSCLLELKIVHSMEILALNSFRLKPKKGNLLKKTEKGEKNEIKTTNDRFVSERKR